MEAFVWFKPYLLMENKMIRTDIIKSINQILIKQAQEQKSKIAFSDIFSQISYIELDIKTSHFAKNIINQGINKGESVALILPNSVEWVIACLATLRAGCSIVPISFESTNDEIGYKLSDSNTKLVITSYSNKTKLSEINKSFNINNQKCFTNETKNSNDLSFNEFCFKSNYSIELIDDDIDAPSYIVYTSGTTGKPKGVILTSRSMLWVVASCWLPIVELNSKDIILSPLPLFHSYAINLCVLGVIASGCTEFILDKFSPQQIFDLIQNNKFTFLPGVPTMFHYLLETAENKNIHHLNGISRCASAGAIMPGTLNREFEEQFKIELLDGYGITETSTMVTMNWKGKNRKMGSCGIPIPGMTVRIIDPNNNLDVNCDEEGELICNGPNLMVGYHNKTKETQKVLKNKWYHTGDLAKRDKDGFIKITGRLKEIIIRGGQNISPTEVEEIIVQYKEILDCAVVGDRHIKLGEIPIAFLVLKNKENFNEVKLINHCKMNLSDYKIPEKFLIIDKIPRTGSGKIMRYKLINSC
jgi:acyl-CoA synthetase (AMP-forming)/AMP-acid ligase II